MYIDGKVTVSEMCPQSSGGCDLTSHDFTFVVLDTADVPDGPHVKTEVFGYFQPAGTPKGEWTANAADTVDITVPIDSPVARMAHEIHRDASGVLARAVGEVLRQSVRVCPCAFREECPALSAVNLLHAMEAATA